MRSSSEMEPRSSLEPRRWYGGRSSLSPCPPRHPTGSIRSATSTSGAVSIRKRTTTINKPWPATGSPATGARWWPPWATWATSARSAAGGSRRSSTIRKCSSCRRSSATSAASAPRWRTWGTCAPTSLGISRRLRDELRVAGACYLLAGIREEEGKIAEAAELLERVVAIDRKYQLPKLEENTRRLEALRERATPHPSPLPLGRGEGEG